MKSIYFLLLLLFLNNTWAYPEIVDFYGPINYPGESRLLKLGDVLGENEVLLLPEKSYLIVKEEGFDEALYVAYLEGPGKYLIKNEKIIVIEAKTALMIINAGSVKIEKENKLDETKDNNFIDLTYPAIAYKSFNEAPWVKYFPGENLPEEAKKMFDKIVVNLDLYENKIPPKIKINKENKPSYRNPPDWMPAGREGHWVNRTNAWIWVDYTNSVCFKNKNRSLCPELQINHTSTNRSPPWWLLVK